MSHRIFDNLAPIVERGIAAHGMGEDIAWEATLMPTPEGAPTVVLFFWMPGHLVGHKGVGSIAVQQDPSTIEEGPLLDSIRDFFAQMREARSRALAEQGGPIGAQASGLILPGVR